MQFFDDFDWKRNLKVLIRSLSLLSKKSFLLNSLDIINKYRECWAVS